MEKKAATDFLVPIVNADFDETEKPDGLIRAGHSVIGVPKRGSAKGGMISGANFARAAGGGGVLL